MATACGRLGFGSASSTDGAASTRSRLSLAAPAAPLVDFPLMVALDDSRAARDLMQPDASDLRFYDAGGAMLAYEIEQLGAPGGAPLVAWVRVPLIDGPITLDIDYGHAAPPKPTDSVWSPAYAAVYHLADLTDATTNHHDGTWSGGAQNAAAGMIGPTRAFVGAQSDAIAVADAPSLSFTQITASGWLNAQTLVAGSGYAAIVSRENGASVNDDFWIGADNAMQRCDSVVTTTNGAQLGGPADAVTLGTWTHLAMTYDGSSTEVLYKDGVAIKTTAVTGAMLHGAHAILLGADRNNGGQPDADFVDGMLDEVRIESVARSADWVAYDVASQRDQVITYGPVDRGP
jgi:hypothetical protein